MRKLFLLVVLATIVTLGAQAQEANKVPGKRGVPAYRGIIDRVQPNGDTLQTYLRGDEHMHWMMTIDGWLIRENKKGWLVYAKKNRKGEVVTSRRKAHNEANRSRCEKCWLRRKGISLTNKI